MQESNTTGAHFYRLEEVTGPIAELPAGRYAFVEGETPEFTPAAVTMMVISLPEPSSPKSVAQRIRGLAGGDDA